MACFRAMGAKGDSQMITFLCFGSVNRYLKREVNEKKVSVVPSLVPASLGKSILFVLEVHVV